MGCGDQHGMLRPWLRESESQTCTKTLHSPNPSRFTWEEKSMAIDPQYKVGTRRWQTAGSWHLTGAVQRTWLGVTSLGTQLRGTGTPAGVHGCRPPHAHRAPLGSKRRCQSTCRKPSQRQIGHIHGAWVALARALARTRPAPAQPPPGSPRATMQPARTDGQTASAQLHAVSAFLFFFLIICVGQRMTQLWAF